MYFGRKIDGSIRPIPGSQGGQHIPFCGDANTCSSSFQCFLTDIIPHVPLYLFDLKRLRITIDLGNNGFDLFSFKVDDIIHDPQCLACMLCKFIGIKNCLFGKGGIHIAVQVECQKAAAVVRTEGNLPAWICRNSFKAKICIAIGYGFI